MFKVYQDGALVLSVEDKSGVTHFGSNPAYFFQDNLPAGGASGEANAGAIDYLRVFNTALSAAALPPAREADGDYVAVCRNGNLELNIRGTSSLAIVRSGLANLLQDDQRQEKDGRRVCAQEAASDPVSLGMLGAGFALLG